MYTYLCFFSSLLAFSVILTDRTAAPTQMQKHNGQVWQLFWANCECESKPRTIVSCEPLCDMYESLNVLTLKSMTN